MSRRKEASKRRKRSLTTRLQGLTATAAIVRVFIELFNMHL